MTDNAVVRNAEIPTSPGPSSFAPVTESCGNYNSLIDYGRFAAITIITLFHAKAPIGQFFSAAVSFFIIIMVFFSMQTKKTEQPIFDIVVNRVHRLLAPWAFWLAVYATAKTAKVMVEGGDFNAELAAWLPPAGTFGQLWFLPFAFVVSVTLTSQTRRLCFIATSRVGWIALISLAVFISVSAIILATRSGPQIAGMMIYIIYFPSVAFGVLLTLAKSRRARSIIAFGALALGVILTPLGEVQTQQLLLGVPLACLALEARLSDTNLARKLGQISMGIYLTHLLVIAALPRVTGIDPSTLIGGALCVLGATALALLIDATPMRRLT